MTITRADVADLQPGDVVEFRVDDWPESHAIRTTLRINDHGALVAPIPGDDSRSYWIRDPFAAAFDGEHRTLTVVSRAPRPLYVNSARTEPVPGDVVRDADDEGRSRVWVHLPHAMFQPDGPWVTQSGNEPIRRRRPHLPARLRLLVDGETGLPPAVQS